LEKIKLCHYTVNLNSANANIEKYILTSKHKRLVFICQLLENYLVAVY